MGYTAAQEMEQAEKQDQLWQSIASKTQTSMQTVPTPDGPVETFSFRTSARSAPAVRTAAPRVLDGTAGYVVCYDKSL